MNTSQHQMFTCFVLLWLQTVTTQAAMTVTNIAAGDSHNFFIQSDGSLWAMGLNLDGELGNHTNISTNAPQKIVSGGVTAIASGYSHTLFLMSDGSLWATGKNTLGELGDGTFNGTNAPEMIVPGGVTAIAAGDEYSLFLMSDGSLWATGRNDFGQLGDGTLRHKVNTPEPIVPSGVTAISAGEMHSLFLMSDGSLWAMGYNVYGQLGDGAYYISTNIPQQILAGNVTAISAGGSHSLFLMSDGSLWAMGDNSDGQLGDGTPGQNNSTNLPEKIVPSGVIAIAAGGNQSLFIESDGSLWGMGDNGSGELGTGNYISTNRPEQLLSGNVATIAARSDSIFVKSNGSLWIMGPNEYGELGNGTNSFDSDTPQEIVPFAPIIVGISLSGTNLVLNGANGRSGGTYYLLTSTNLAMPLSLWTPCATNVLGATGDFTITATNAVNPNDAQQFYILQSQ
jgi:alpha-tubulin suppressor-like RCC1 family protein